MQKKHAGTSTGQTAVSDSDIVDETFKLIGQWGGEGTGSKPFFKALATHLAEALDVYCVIVGKLSAGSEDKVKTVVLHKDGKIVPNMEYELAGSPCENVIGCTLCCYPDNIQERFPADRLLVDMRAVGYCGMPLWNSEGRPLGIIAVIDIKPIANPDLIKTLLQIVAVRAAAELQHNFMLAELNDSRQRFQDFAAASSDWFWEMDEKLRFTWFSPDVERVTGVPAEWHYGKTREEIGRPDIESERWEEHLETLRRHEPFKDFVYLRRGPDGDKWMRAAGLPVFDSGGRFRRRRTGRKCCLLRLLRV
jgi:PAS domain-containing protein